MHSKRVKMWLTRFAAGSLVIFVLLKICESWIVFDWIGSKPDSPPITVDDVEVRKFIQGGSPGLPSVYGSRLVVRKSWVRIPAPYPGWAFFTFICGKNCNLRLQKYMKKRSGLAHLKNNWYLIFVSPCLFVIRWSDLKLWLQDTLFNSKQWTSTNR